MAKLNLVVDNVWTYLKPENGQIDEETAKVIEKAMSYTVSEYVPARRIAVEFDKTLLDTERLRYPTGLYSNLAKICGKKHISFGVVDERTLPTYTGPLKIHGKKPRDYQSEIVEDSIQAERGIIKVATGGGKTVIGAMIIGRLNLKTLFIVNTVDLLVQAYDELRAILKVEIGRVGGGYCNISRINVCTIQTLHSALDLKYELFDTEYHKKEKISPQVLARKQEIRAMVEDAEIVVVDEVHHMRANSYINMMTHAKNAYYKFGMSATPYRLDSADIILNAYSGRQIANVSASYLIDKGWLVPPKIYILDPNDLPEYEYLHGHFRTIYNEWIVKNEKRNNMIVQCVERFMELDKTTLITVSRIPHGETLLEMIDKLGVRVAFIKGEVDKKTRKKLLDQIRARELKVLIGTSLADEGLDLPALDSAIMAGGGKSVIKSLQRVGRTLRPYPNAENNQKKEAVIVDFYDHIRYLTGQSRQRMKIYRQEDRFEVLEHF